MSKHTAGPWTVEPPRESDHENGIDRKWYWSIRANGPKGCISHELARLSGRDFDSDEYTARLISAAPELLEALTKRVKDAESDAFEEWITSGKPSGDAENVDRQWLRSSEYSDFRLEWRQELDAIAKATGKTE